MKEAAEARAHTAMLRNILPPSVINQLKDGRAVTSQCHGEVLSVTQCPHAALHREWGGCAAAAAAVRGRVAFAVLFLSA